MSMRGQTSGRAVVVIRRELRCVTQAQDRQALVSIEEPDVQRAAGQASPAALKHPSILTVVSPTGAATRQEIPR